MTTGMGWLCKLPDLAANIRAAAERYERKYGRRPELCFVHPSMGTAQVDKITVRPWRYILPGCLWVGIEEMPTTEATA